MIHKILNHKDHKIYCGSCFDINKEIKDKSCKLLFADPPYNMGKSFGNNKDKWDTIEDYKNWTISWIEKFYNKISDDGSIMIMGHPRFSSYLIPYLDKKFFYTNQIIFYYTDGMPEKKNFEKRYEMVLYYRKNEKKYIFNIDPVRVPLIRYDKTSNPKGKNPNDVWQINRVRWNSKERIRNEKNKIYHVSKKPLRLLRRIILSTTNSNDYVLDPFLGTGTTSVVCKELGRKSIGIEINKEYAELAKNRVIDTKAINSKIDPENR